MSGILITLITIASILLIVVVYVQNPKGGGLSSDFGAAQQIGGVQKTNDFIEKATWTLASFIAVASIFLTINLKSPNPTVKKKNKQTTETNKSNSPTGKKPAKGSKSK